MGNHYPTFAVNHTTIREIDLINEEREDNHQHRVNHYPNLAVNHRTVWGIHLINEKRKKITNRGLTITQTLQ